MERITAVIFDMDGLMFDTEQLYERTWGQAVSEQGKVFTRKIHSLIMGRSKAGRLWAGFPCAEGYRPPDAALL